jgi:ribonuclease P protein component
VLSKQHRFHGLTALNFAHKQGKVVRGSFCSLKYVRNERRQSYRVAVVVSKKVSKSAVVRNRIRRRVYEIVRTKTVITEPYDLIFMIYSAEVATMDAEKLEKVIIGQLRQTNSVLH